MANNVLELEDSSEEYQFTQDELNDFLGEEGAAMLPDHLIKAEAEVDTEEKEPDATVEKTEEEAEEETDEKKEVSEEPEVKAEPDSEEINALKDELAASKAELAALQSAGLKDEPKEEKVPLSTREQLGLPDLNDEKYQSTFELDPDLKELMASQQAVIIKQHESLQQNTKALEEAQTLKFWGAVGSQHPDYSDYVAADGQPTKKAVEWIGKQPAFLQGAYSDTLEKGGANAVSELLTMIKGTDQVQEKADTAVKEDKVDPKEEQLRKKIEAGKKKLEAAEEGEQGIPSSLSSVSGEVVDNPYAAIEGSSDPVEAARRATGGNLRKFESEILDKMVA